MLRYTLLSSLFIISLITTFGSADSDVLELWLDGTRANIFALLAPQIESDLGMPTQITQIDDLEAIPNNLIEALSSGEQGPDILLTLDQSIFDLVNAGAVAPIEMGDELRSQFAEGALNTLTVNGKLYGVPFVSQAIILYYNKELISNPPTTFEELISQSQSLIADGSIDYGLSFDPRELFFSIPFISAFGGYVFGEPEPGVVDHCDVGLNNADAIAGVKFMLDRMIDGTLSGDIADYADPLNAFGDVKSAFHINGPWVANALASANFKVGAIAIPTIDGEIARPFLTILALALSSNADDPEAAADFLINNFASLETQQFISFEDFRGPAYLPLLEDGTVPPGTAQHAVGQITPHGLRKNSEGINSVWGPMSNALVEIFENGAPVESSLNDAVNTILEENNCL